MPGGGQGMSNFNVPSHLALSHRGTQLTLRIGLYIGSERGEKGIASLEGFVGKVIEVVD